MEQEAEEAKAEGKKTKMNMRQQRSEFLEVVQGWEQALYEGGEKERISGIERTEKNGWRGVWGRWRTGFLEHGEEVHGQEQEHVRLHLWGRAQDEEGGDGGADHHRGKTVGVQQMQHESPTIKQAVSIASIRRVESLWFLWSCGRQGKEPSCPGPGNEGRLALAQPWVSVREVFAGFSPWYYWHSEGWTPRDEALMEARTTRHPWLVACDDNMDPKDFRRGL